MEPEHIAWAVHCALGSAFEVCMPSNSSLPLDDLTQPGAADTLKDWYTQNSGGCTLATTEAACAQLGSERCEYRTRPCPAVAEHASLQVDSVKYWGPDSAAKRRHEL